MEYGLAAIALLAAVALYSYFQKKKRLADLRTRLKAGWGSVPAREYSWEEFERISHYFNRRQEDCGFYIDDITWNDLDMDEVFRLVNHTWSSVGEEYLYYLLRTPFFDGREAERRNRLISWFQHNQEGRERIELEFCKMGRVRRIALADYIFRFAELPGSGTVRHWVQDFALIGAILGVFWNPSVFIMAAVVMVVLNVYTYYSKKAEVESFFSCIGYLLAMAETSRALRPLCTGELKELGERAGQAGAVFFKVKKYARMIKYQETLSGSLADMIMDYVRILFHIDLIAFETVRSFVAAHQREAETLYESLGMLESCSAAASYRESLEAYAVPEFSATGPLQYRSRNMYHPLIGNPVKNSIDEEACVLLTGSNASGKSTFLKTAAINALFAQTIVTCLADSYQGCFYRIYSSMALRDDIQGAESYYIVEIRALKRILDQAGAGTPVLCFVDEVLRGTNTVERIAASAQILKNLPGRQVLCFAATHDIELTHLLEGIYHNYHFEEEVNDQDIYFPYRLMLGRAMTRNAIKLLKLMGYDGRIIEEAENAAGHFVETGEWKL